MSALVSVVMCSYNQGQFIRDAIESVRNQSYPNWELIVVDNGSKDGTRELLEPYRSDERIKLLLHAENQAVTRRLNEGIANSHGQFISILYADDYYLARKLERQIECFSRLDGEYGVVYSPGYRLDVTTGKQTLQDTMRASGWVLEELLLHRGYVNPISPLMRRAVFERYPYQEDLFIEGESINLRFAMTFKFQYLDEPLVVMREHETNIGKAIKANIDWMTIILDKLEKSADLPPSAAPAVRIFRSRMLRDAGWQGVRVVGDIEWARECYRRAIEAYPWQRFHPRTLAGRTLALLPKRGRALLNRIGHRLRGYSGVGYVERPDIERTRR
jgi:alpha-1,3-rhamnosyltransferase